jgi:hypothetical protein
LKASAAAAAAAVEGNPGSAWVVWVKEPTRQVSAYLDLSAVQSILVENTFAWRSAWRKPYLLFP